MQINNKQNHNATQNQSFTTNSNNNIPQNKEKENSKSLETNEVDYEQLALERCRLEIQGFDDMPQFRKDVNIGIMLQRIARGE